MSTDLSDRLRKAREDANLTQDAAAEALGVGRTRIAEWETGVHRPRAETLARLADVYGVPVASLFGRRPENRMAVPAEAPPPELVGPTVPVPLMLLSYWRGRVEEQRNTVAGVQQTLGGLGDSLRALHGMLEKATAGMTGFIDSGLFPAIPQTAPPSAVMPTAETDVAALVARWPPEEVQRAFAVVESATAARVAMDARLAQQPASDQAPAPPAPPAPGATPPPPAAGQPGARPGARRRSA